MAKRQKSTAAEILGTILDSELGKGVGDVLSEALAKLLGVETGGKYFQDLSREAAEAARNLKKTKGKTDDAYKILGLRPDAPEEVVRAAYRARAMKAHPDRGGSSKEMAKVNKAYQQIIKERGWGK
ncbi:hypothetical protein ES704_03498 [subsurface metagenome]|jgi:hypothetical protein